MIYSYIVLAFRNLYRNKVTSFITILGLSIGLASFIVIGLYVRKELSYDTHFTKSDHIYRINTWVDVNGIQNTYSAAHYPAAYDLTKEYPEVRQALTLYSPIPFQGIIPKLKYEENIFSERNLFFTDSSFFSFFDFPLEYGEISTAFKEPNSLVLTHETSTKLFGDVDPIDRIVILNDSVSLKVTGVLAPVLFNTHLKFDALVYANSLLQSYIGRNIKLHDSYIGLWYYSYILLAPGTSPANLTQHLPDFVKRHYPPRYTDNQGALTLQNVKDIHLRSNFSGGDISVNGSVEYIYILSIIGSLILIVSAINFVNLSSARYMKRAKEVGLRKAVGAQRTQLMYQFISEAILITLLAGLIAIIVIIYTIPIFNNLANATLTLSEMLNLATMGQGFMICILVGLLSGIYPAFVLSGYNPTLVLKGITEKPGNKFTLRKALIVIQFSVSMGLLIGTFVVYQQLAFLENRNMGFDRDKVLIISVPGVPIFQQYPTFKNEVARLSNIKSITNISHNLGQSNLAYFPLIAEGKNEEQMIPVMNVGYDFLETFNISMVSGRFFNSDFRSDSTLAYVINETAAKTFGWTDPVGRKLKAGFQGIDSSRVIGVVRDFNFDPLKSNIGPLAITFSNAFGNIAIKMNGNSKETLNEIEAIWKSIYPGIPFNSYLLDEGLKSAYAAERRVSKIYTLFCLISLLLASMGLFALASFTIQKRMKEIGVRKILGASSSGIVILIYKEFFVLISIAFTIAAPISIIVFEKWLSTFAFRIDLRPIFFIISVLIVILISWSTLAFHLIRASRVNPSSILRNE
ncbi:ABC transporter permease [soil metagenome]